MRFAQHVVQPVAAVTDRWSIVEVTPPKMPLAKFWFRMNPREVRAKAVLALLGGGERSSVYNGSSCGSVPASRKASEKSAPPWGTAIKPGTGIITKA